MFVIRFSCCNNIITGKCYDECNFQSVDNTNWSGSNGKIKYTFIFFFKFRSIANHCLYSCLNKFPVILCLIWCFICWEQMNWISTNVMYVFKQYCNRTEKKCHNIWKKRKSYITEKEIVQKKNCEFLKWFKWTFVIESFFELLEHQLQYNLVHWINLTIISASRSGWLYIFRMLFFIYHVRI